MINVDNLHGNRHNNTIGALYIKCRINNIYSITQFLT